MIVPYLLVVKLDGSFYPPTLKYMKSEVGTVFCQELIELIAISIIKSGESPKTILLSIK